jgi:AraC-like DNA-binding protein
MASASHPRVWTRVPISSVEDLGDAVLGAGLRVTQLSRAPVTGSLVFATAGDIVCSSGSIGGRVSLTGPLSETHITVGVGLVMGHGTRHWLNETGSGSVGVFLAGDEHDALYTPGSLYVAVTLPAGRLEAMAAAHDLVLDARTLGGTGIAARPLPASSRLALEAQFRRLHADSAAAPAPSRVEEIVLRALIAHLARPPRLIVGSRDPRGHSRIVARARAFIHANLHRPLTIDLIAEAAVTSLRTLTRAFQAVLGETPYSYVLKLRLHRIRHELISSAELDVTIRCIARRWGIHEMGRFAGWYRDLFGELPSLTRVRHLPANLPPRALWQDVHSPSAVQFGD